MDIDEAANDNFEQRQSENLEVRSICGYVAIRSNKKQGWLYLRKHSDNGLFIGNMPTPDWFHPDKLAHRETTEQQHARMKEIIQRMVPGADSVNKVFSTGNGRLAAHIKMKNTDRGAQEVLSNPRDHLYMQWEGQDERFDKQRQPNVVGRWLEKYKDERDERKVGKWANATMAGYEAREKAMELEKEQRTKEAAVPDADGFVTVTNGAKQMKAAEAVAVRVGRGHYKSKSARNRKNLLDLSKGIEKSGFYRWQREKKNNVVELQKKFKDDQKRVAAIRGLESNQ